MYYLKTFRKAKSLDFLLRIGIATIFSNRLLPLSLETLLTPRIGFATLVGLPALDI